MHYCKSNTKGLRNAEKSIQTLIIYMKKLPDSDWLRAVQLKCNTSAKSVTSVQITHRNSRL